MSHMAVFREQFISKSKIRFISTALIIETECFIIIWMPMSTLPSTASTRASKCSSYAWIFPFTSTCTYGRVSKIHINNFYIWLNILVINTNYLLVIPFKSKPVPTAVMSSDCLWTCCVGETDNTPMAKNTHFKST